MYVWRRANALVHDDGTFTSVSLRCHLCGLHLMGMYVCMANRWLVAADVWEVNTEAVFHCWCRCGMMTYNSALGVVPMHWRTTTVR